MRQKIKLTIIFLFLFIIIVVFIQVRTYIISPYKQKDNEKKIEIVIPNGASLNQIADTLLTKQLIDSKRLFSFWARILRYDDKLKAGYFSVPPKMTYPQILSFFRKAKTKEIKVTLIEGWDNEHIAAKLQKKLNISEEKFITLTKDTLFVSKLGINKKDILGYLLPNTYQFYWGVTEESVIRELVQRTISVFERDSVKKAMKDLNLSMHQILTMASIIEGEAIFDDERPIIASVYYNRLRRHIKLQADPTIQFIIDGPPKRLLYKDLEIDSPYNTYLYYGLPPGPINNPGINSIMAALFPVKTKYIFFAAKGDGRHKFSKTSKEHAKAHSELNRLREIERRKKRASKGF